MPRRRTPTGALTLSSDTDSLSLPLSRASCTLQSRIYTMLSFLLLGRRSVMVVGLAQQAKQSKDAKYIMVHFVFNFLFFTLCAHDYS